MSKTISLYYSPEWVDAAVSEGRHREIIGGMWDEIGTLQFETLVSYGLRPTDRLLDVGCGSLRGGVHFIRYLEAGNYFGFDMNEALMEAGYTNELGPLGLQERMPRANLLADARFDFDGFDGQFDKALAISLFTHLPLDNIRICLERLKPRMVIGGVFYATYFEATDGQPTYLDINQEPGGIVTHGDSDPFHHRVDDFRYLCASTGWELNVIGDFGHPRNQKLLAFTRAT